MLRFYVTVAFLLFFTISFAQTRIPKHADFDPRKTTKPLSIQTMTAAQAAADTTVVDSVVNFIVRLRTSPGARTAAARQSLSSTINQEHQDFLAGLNSLNNNVRTSPGTNTISVVREFRRSINGFTIKANRSLSAAIGKMPHVISVSEDKKVQANDESSNDVINVPKAWNELNAKGDGIVIGIIDTGIDYQHPDLGGGIGPNKKVIGGYDFINNDADPRDDHGHGTHVAGIAAANGTLKGVAPNAKLMAIKVLNSYGSGSDSQVLAGIEYAMDPDGNPSTDDAPDVVNMSLGRTPDPNEPMSEAVNNAVMQGIVFCVAAGNDYGYMKIGTPGIAEQAITVAATDNYDVTAVFSSRGPATGSFVLKPDVAAPGVDITSSFLNSGYTTMSGTSMATPHVTGVVALMRGKHPDWTPGDVKAALMSTTKFSMESNPLEKGAGVIDAYKAISADIVMSPGSISYGKIDNTPGTFTKQDIITVSNKGTSAQQISLAVDGVTSAAIGVSLSPSTFQLQPGASKEVTVSISVNKSSLEKTNAGEGHYATVELSSGDKRAKTVLSLFNPTVTTIQFPNTIPGSIIVMGMTNRLWEPYNPNSGSLDLILPPGTYDIVAWFAEGMVFVEDFQAGYETGSVIVDSQSAKNTVTLQALDDNGDPIPGESQNLTASTTMTGPNLLSFWFWPQFTFQISDTKKYKIWNRYCYSSPVVDKIFEVTLTTGEVTSSKVVSNDPADFVPVNYTNPSIKEGQNQELTYYARSSFVTSWGTPIQVRNPAKFMVSDMPDQSTSSFYRFSPLQGLGGAEWETASRRITPENGMQILDFGYAPIKTLGNGPYDIHLGNNLVNFTGVPNFYDDRFLISMYNVYGVYNHAYFERISAPIDWKMTKDGEPFSTGSFLNTTIEDAGPWDVLVVPVTETGNYKLTLDWNDYYVAGRFGEVKTEISFSKDYPFVPSITKFELTSDGKITNTIESGKGGIVEMQMSWWDTQVKLEMKPVDSENWTTLSLTSPGEGVKRATLPDNMHSGHYSLRLTSENFGNSITHTLEPAFAIGEQDVVTPFTKVNLITPVNYDVNAGVDPLFTWSEIPNATYLFELSESPLFTDVLASRQVSDEQLTLTFHLAKDETYYWRVRGTIAGIDLPWSNVFNFKASKLAAATLLTPADNASNISGDQITLTWLPAGGNAIWQTVDASTDENSGWVAYGQLGPQESSYQLPPLPGGTKYYWRVTTLYFPPLNQPGMLNVVSDVFSFRTKGNPGSGPGSDPDVVTGLENADNSAKAFPNPFTDRAFIRVYSQTEARAHLKLLDQLGRPVRMSDHSLAKGENTIIIESESSRAGEMPLTQGLYIAVIELDSGLKFHVKFARK